jgi:F-type H+-transporting ATPase subunit b
MEWNWSTFVLEIINFLVLVWILQRFLYRPVLDIIAERQKAIQARLDEARQLKEESESLRNSYGSRLGEWEKERAAAREQLERDLDAERARQRGALADELEREKEKSRVVDERKEADKKRETERQALLQAAAFSAKLLAAASGPELEQRLVDVLLRDLEGLGEDRVADIRERSGGTPDFIDVASGYDLDTGRRQHLASALQKLFGESVEVRFRIDTSLIAGLRVVVGSWVLAADVQDELRGFAEFANGRG